MAASGWVATTWRRSTGPVRWARPSTSSRGAGGLTTAAVLLLFGWLAAAAPAPDDPATAQLRAELALAKSDSFYLVLDLERAELRLMLGGVPLRVFACSETTLASPRVAFRPAPAPADWPDRVWRDGRLDPRPDEDRPLIVPPGQAGGTDEPPPPPALPQEGPPPPPRYRLRFSGGLDLEVCAAAAAPSRRLLGDRRDALAGSGHAALRLRLTLSDDDAAHFYRCLPPGIALVVRGRPA